VAPDVTLHLASGVPATKPVEPTKQFQSVLVLVRPLLWFRTMLPSFDSKPLGLPFTSAPAPSAVKTMMSSTAVAAATMVLKGLRGPSVFQIPFIEPLLSLAAPPRLRCTKRRRTRKD